MIIIWVALSASVPSGELRPPVKKLNKTIARLWKGSTFILETLGSGSCKAPEGIYYTIVTAEDTLGYAFVGRVNSCRSGGCSIENEGASLDFEYFDYFFITDKQFSIRKVKVYNYEATYGHEVMGWGWLRQFIGFSGGEKLVYSKDIQAISGATVSAKALTENIQYSQASLKEKVQSLLEEYTSRRHSLTGS